MKLYHGTQEWRADCIEAEGFLGSELQEFTDGTLLENGVVFCSSSLAEARLYGEAIFVIEDDSLAVFFQESPASGAPEYWLPANIVNQELPFWRL